MAIATGTAILGAALVGGGVAALSGSKAASAQKQAAQSQEAIGREQIDLSRDIYNQTRADLASSRVVGESALFKLADLYGVSRPRDTQDERVARGYNALGANDNIPITAGTGAFETSPGYQFRLQEGVNALDKSAAARGKLNSGGQYKALTAFGQGLASEEFNNYTNALRSLAGIGQTADAAAQGAGQAYVANTGQASGMVSNAIGNAGNARASSYANTGSAINQGINNALTAYMFSKSPLLTGAA